MDSCAQGCLYGLITKKQTEEYKTVEGKTDKPDEDTSVQEDIPVIQKTHFRTLPIIDTEEEKQPFFKSFISVYWFFSPAGKTEDEETNSDMIIEEEMPVKTDTGA